MNDQSWKRKKPKSHVRVSPFKKDKGKGIKDETDLPGPKRIGVPIYGIRAKG
jgi:hypothetical protein